MLLDVDVLIRRLVSTDDPFVTTGLFWFNEPHELLDFLCIAISLLAEVRPDSELALQFPLDEFGSSQRYCLFRLCRRVIDVLSFTGLVAAAVAVAAAVVIVVAVAHTFVSLSIKFVNSLSDDEYSGFCLRFFSAVDFAFALTVFTFSAWLMPPFCVASSSVFSSILLISLSRCLPHCFNALKLVKRFDERKLSMVPLLRNKSFDLLRGIDWLIFSSAAFDEVPTTALCLLLSSYTKRKEKSYIKNMERKKINETAINNAYICV